MDISIFLYKYIRTAGPKKWVDNFVLFLCELKKNGIRPVCIFDGPNPPIEKKREQERRRHETAKVVDRLNECIKIRKIIEDVYIPDIIPPPEDIVNNCKLLIYRGRGVDTTNYEEPYHIKEALDKIIDRLENQTMPITDAQRDLAFEIVQVLGLNAIKAPGEAEKLCAQYAVEGKVDGVLTEDTDVLAYGTPIMFAFKDYKLNDKKIYMIYMKSLLEALGLTQEEFTDLCILLSCDYNSRVKGYPPGKNCKKAVNIGVKHAYAMIQEHRRLEQVCEYVLDEAPLIYPRCRELFSFEDDSESSDLFTIQDGAVNKKRYAEIVEEMGSRIDLEYVLRFFDPVEVCFED